MYTWLPVRDVCGGEDKPVKIREVTYFMKYIPWTRALIYTRIHIDPGNAGGTRVQNFGGISRLREKVNAFSGWARIGNGTCTILPFLHIRIPQATDQTYASVYCAMCTHERA